MQVGDERRVGKPGTRGERRLRSARAERGLEDRQRHLPRQPVVREAGASVRSVDREIGLRVLELLEESVFEDVHFVQVVRPPHVAAAIPQVAGLDDGARTDFSLDADVPRLDVRRPQVALHRREAVREGEVSLIERAGIGGRKRHERRQCALQRQAARREPGCDAGPQIARAIELAQFGNAGDGDVFNEDVRRFQDERVRIAGA